MSASVTLDDVDAAAARIGDFIVRTPLLPWGEDPAAYVKAESLQRTGSFKARGAFNAVALAAEKGATGVLACSSGNHGRAVAGSSARLGLRCAILLPRDAPAVKTDAVRRLGAEVRFYDRYDDDREAIGRAWAEDASLTVIQSSGDPAVIAGQGTVVREVLRDLHAEPDEFIVPVGGGGLLAGSAVVLNALAPSTALVGVEPTASPDAKATFANDRLISVPPAPSLADGLLLASLSEFAFAVARGGVSEIRLADDETIAAAVREALHRTGLMLEPSGAVALTALSGGAGVFRVAVASGRNLSLSALRSLLDGVAQPILGR